MSIPIHAFVTGGTGLIGRAVVQRLLARGVNVTLMLRADARERRRTDLDALALMADGARGSLRQVAGDLTEPGLGLSQEGLSALSESGHCFHLAALYDIEAAPEAIERTNVEGTRNLLSALRETGFSGRLHHVSSIAVAGDYAGTFTEAMFEEGQRLAHAYHRSKHQSEKLVRESGFDHFIYRPSSVVGDSKTGAIDRVDGVYYGFAAIQKVSQALPRWLRIPVPHVRGAFNLVPVDYVADAIIHIAFTDTGARVFHLVDPHPPSLLKMTNTFLSAAKGPRLGPAVDIQKLPGLKKASALASMLPSVRELRDALLGDLGLPTDSLGAMNLEVRFDDRNTQAALADSGISCPPLKTYAKTLFRYYEDHLDPMAQRPLRYRRALCGKVVLVTGGSRGIGLVVAKMAADAGAEVLLVARDAARLARHSTSSRPVLARRSRCVGRGSARAARGRRRVDPQCGPLDSPPHHGVGRPLPRL